MKFTTTLGLRQLSLVELPWSVSSESVKLATHFRLFFPGSSCSLKCTYEEGGRERWDEKEEERRRGNEAGMERTEVLERRGSKEGREREEVGEDDYEEGEEQKDEEEDKDSLGRGGEWWWKKKSD